MWSRRSHILSPLASLTSKQAKWHWGEVEQKVLGDIKIIIAEEVLYHIVFSLICTPYNMGGVYAIPKNA
jgi:hypothetical protein